MEMKLASEIVKDKKQVEADRLEKARAEKAEQDAKHDAARAARVAVVPKAMPTCRLEYDGWSVTFALLRDPAVRDQVEFLAAALLKTLQHIAEIDLQLDQLAAAGQAPSEGLQFRRDQFHRDRDRFVDRLGFFGSSSVREKA